MEDRRGQKLQKKDGGHQEATLNLVLHTHGLEIVVLRVMVPQHAVFPSLFTKGNGNFTLLDFSLKGLSHEIDFKNFDKKLHNLA